MLKSEYLDEIEKINTHCVLPYQIDKTFYQIKNWVEQYEIEHHESVLWDLLRTFFFDWNNRSAMNEVAQDALDEDGWRGVAAGDGFARERNKVGRSPLALSLHGAVRRHEHRGL